MSRHAYLVASVLFTTLVLAKFNLETGLTSLIRFGDKWQDRRHSALQNLPVATVPDSNGYDGQFYAQIALDPLLRGPELTRVIDAPAYRARRILVPSAAAVLGLGHPWWILQAYALLNVVCWFALGWLLYDSLGSSEWMSFARWAGCMFSMGVLESVRQSLVDLPALLLLALAIRSWTQAHRSNATFWLMLGNLAKETNLLGTLALQGEGLFHKSSRWRTLTSLLIAALPLGLWSLYVHQRFSSTPVAEGLDNFTWPLLGLITEAKLCVNEILQGHIDGRYTFGLTAIASLILQAVVLWRHREYQSPWWRVGAIYALLLPFLGLWVWSGYWAACRAVLPLTIAFNLLLPANRTFWPLWVFGNLTVLHALWRFL